MPNVTVYLPDDQHTYLREHGLKPSEMLQAAIRQHRVDHDALESKFREELERYRTSPERKIEWEAEWDARSGPPAPFVPCETCGTAVDPAEGCGALAEPYDAAPVALLAHYPDDMRRANLQYWADSGYRDVAVGMPG